jgi:hypothetical protein
VKKSLITQVSYISNNSQSMDKMIAPIDQISS